LALKCSLALPPFATITGGSGRREAQRRVELSALEVAFQGSAEDAIPIFRMTPAGQVMSNARLPTTSAIGAMDAVTNVYTSRISSHG
jgi:hypothetical protein